MRRYEETVRSLWIPLRGMNLLLPNVAVAEISPYRVPDSLKDAPDWLLGTLAWRERSLPVISFETLCGEPVPTTTPLSRITVLNSVIKDSPLPFYALISAGIPRLLQLERRMEGVSVQLLGAGRAEGMLYTIMVRGEEAIIPDLEFVQSVLERNLEEAA